MNSEQEIKGASRILRELQDYIKEAEKQKGKRLPSAVKSEDRAQERKKGRFTHLIMVLAQHDRELNEPPQKDNRAVFVEIERDLRQKAKEKQLAEDQKVIRIKDPHPGPRVAKDWF
jgi:hypothetical protein